MNYRILKPGFFTYYIQNVETEKIEEKRFKDLSELQTYADAQGWKQVEQFHN